MPSTKIATAASRLLTALPTKDRQRLLQRCSPVDLVFGDILYETGERMQHVYFPKSGLVSLLVPVDRHTLAEVGIVGNEGMVGVSVALGAKLSSGRALVQGSGEAMRMRSASFTDEIGHSPALRRQLNYFLLALTTQIAQTAACNLHHKLAPRLARWLLMTHDRLRSDEFFLTQEFLALMLGVQRPGVTAAANALRGKKLIDYSRGNIIVLNRRGLERVACPCYRTIEERAGNRPH